MIHSSPAEDINPPGDKTVAYMFRKCSVAALTADRINILGQSEYADLIMSASINISQEMS